MQINSIIIQDFPPFCLIMIEKGDGPMDKMPSKDEFEKTLEKLFKTTKEELEYFLNENPAFAIKFSEWVLEATRKNKIITQNKN